MIKISLAYAKLNKADIKYTNAHRKAFREVEKQLLGHNTFRSLFHDLDKSLILYRLMKHEDARKIHQYWAKHHERSARTHSDYIQMVIDWECSRFTKPDKQLNARETLYKYYPHKEKEILPILEELGL